VRNTQLNLYRGITDRGIKFVMDKESFNHCRNLELRARRGETDWNDLCLGTDQPLTMALFVPKFMWDEHATSHATGTYEDLQYYMRLRTEQGGETDSSHSYFGYHDKLFGPGSIARNLTLQQLAGLLGINPDDIRTRGALRAA